jgi:CDP-glucose 4,6-dehydratase
MLNISDLQKQFVGRRIFITGHTGFKGTWLSFLLNQVGANVMGFALEPIKPISLFNLLGMEKKITNIYGDVRDLNKLKMAMNQFQPEYVFHLAAQALVRPSYLDPINTFTTNIIGSTNLLEAVRNCNSVKSLVYITSDKCYENKEFLWGYREIDRLGGIDPYSASKSAAEIIYSSYEQSYFKQKPGIGVASARAGNVIGGGDWSLDRIVPDCIRAIESDNTIKLRNPYATRPWQHVLEPISGYLLLANHLYKEPKKYIGSWNFGPTSNEVNSVEEVAKSIVKYINKGKIENLEMENNLHEAGLLHLNCDKANQQLKWYPRLNFDTTISYTANWYKSYLNGEDVETITKSQIKNYFGE